MMRFIPLSSSSRRYREPKKNEFLITYLLIQRIGSLIIFFNFVFYFRIGQEKGFEDFERIKFCILIFLLILLLKSRGAPFHIWIISSLKFLDWFSIFFLITLQKIRPLLLLLVLTKFNSSFHNELIFLAFLGLIFGVLGIIKINCIKIFILVSSVSHIGWVMIASLRSEFISLFYIAFYFLISFFIILFFYKKNFSNIEEIYLEITKRKLILIIILFFSLRGLPPFIGFLPKIYILIYFMYINWEIVFFLVLFSVLALFCYIKIIYSYIFIYFWKIKKIIFLNVYYNYFFFEILFFIINFYFLFLLIL